jgi:hypothetical protein
MRARGNCYQAAAEWIVDCYMAGQDLADIRVCHGTALGQGPIAGIRFGHAWIEVDEDTVLEVANGAYDEFDRAGYYALGRIRNVQRYDFEQARRAMLDHGVYGPWHDDPEDET